ncbi:MAG: hypothetical protein IPJ69_06195 [Deltaproteobacteria bacterium]|nr:MAG: hypothetical protein IPJ69_06195 [Deltaproteobacteria bacterium]
MSGEIINMAGQRALVYPETPVAPKSIPLEFYAVEVVAKLCSLKNRAGRAFAHLFQSPSHYYSKQFQTLNKLDSESVEEFIDKVHRNLFRQSRADLENICEACVNYFCSGTTNASTRYIRSKLIAAFFQIFSEAASRNDRFSLLILKETFTIIYKEGSLTPQEKRFFEKQINSRSQSINPNTRFHLAKLYFEIRGAHEASVHAYDTREIETESWPHYRKIMINLKRLKTLKRKSII